MGLMLWEAAVEHYPSKPGLWRSQPDWKPLEPHIGTKNELLRELSLFSFTLPSSYSVPRSPSHWAHPIVTPLGLQPYLVPDKE